MKIVSTKFITAFVLIIIILSAFVFRTAGLYHGLDGEYVYHPDTPKQISAIQEYLEGRYYTVKGNLNYDGYPFFNSRLMELGIRLRGIFGGNMNPDRIDLFRETRMQNAFLSTLAVFLTFLITLGISKSRPASLLAAFLMAISPVDIVTCHYAMGDTAAAFFATATVLGAVLIYRSGKMWTYIISGIALTCAFASKYHGVAAGIAVATAHIMRYPHPKKFFGRESLLRIAFAAAAAVIMLPIAIPSMFSEPVKTVQNIAAFLEYTSNFKMSEELMQQSLPQRWIFGITHNYPDLTYMLSGGVIAITLIGTILLVRRNRAILIAAGLPCLYIFVGLPFKPLSHIEYHTLVTPCIFAIAAISIIKIPSIIPQRYRNTALMLTSAMTTVISGLLMARTIYNDFYFSQPDTRRLATEWVCHNLPPSFQVAAGHYSYMGIPPTVAKTDKEGVVMLSSSFRPHQAPDNYASKFTFNLHDNRLELFRNPEITLYVHRSPLLKPDWIHPTFQTVPYNNSGGIVSAESPIFNRNPLQHTVTTDSPLDLLISSENLITNALLVLQTADKPAKIRGHIGKQQVSISLAPNSAKAVRLEQIQREHPMILTANLYRCKLSVTDGPVMAALTLTPSAKAIALTQAGLWKAAADAFDSADIGQPNNPTLTALKRIAETEAHKTDLETKPLQPAINIFEIYGIDPALLKTAPAITITSGELYPDEKHLNLYRTEPVFLSPGAYSIESAASSVAVYKSGTDQQLGTKLFLVPFGTAAVELAIQSDDRPKNGITIHPLPAKTLQYYSAPQKTKVLPL